MRFSPFCPAALSTPLFLHIIMQGGGSVLRRIACIVCTLACALIVASAPYVVARLPVPSAGLTALPYEGWSGVLRMRVYQGFRSGSGSIVPWLNKCLGIYEKRNQGVYVQVETVSAAALGRLLEDEPRPDMLVFTPGALEDAQGLLALDMPGGLIPELAGACAWQQGRGCVPLCYGGYGLIVNTDAMESLPNDWAAALDAQYSAATRSRRAHYALQVPGEGDWPQAARSLLGELPADGRLPDDYLQCSAQKAWQDFARGDVACIPASQWHLRRLALLAAEGKAPAYRFYPSGSGYTDQYFAAALVDTGLGDAEARASACRGVIEYLAGEEAQGRLDLALMLPARAGMRLYPGGGDMTALEEAYLGSAEFKRLFG